MIRPQKILDCECKDTSCDFKKKISVANLQHNTGFGDGVRGAPAGLLCVSACELSFPLVY